LSGMVMAAWLAALPAFLAVSLAASGEQSQFRKTLDCKGRSNGNYVVGCNQFYSICDHGMEIPMKCHGDLVLNPHNNQCDHAANVKACKDRVGTRNNVYKAKEPFTCSNKKDGSYAKEGCSNDYIQCLHGNLHSMKCPYGTVWGAELGACQWPHECTPQSADTPAPQQQVQVVPSQYNSVPQQQAPSQPLEYTPVPQPQAPSQPSQYTPVPQQQVQAVPSQYAAVPQPQAPSQPSGYQPLPQPQATSQTSR
jgi:hypothetical protein